MSLVFLGLVVWDLQSIVTSFVLFQVDEQRLRRKKDESFLMACQRISQPLTLLK